MDTNFADFLREQTLKARSGQQEMIDEKYIKTMSLLWKILTIKHPNYYIICQFIGEKHIKIRITSDHKRLVQKFCKLLDIKHINALSDSFGYMWHTKYVVFDFTHMNGIEKNWFWHPDFVTIELPTWRVYDATS